MSACLLVTRRGKHSVQRIYEVNSDCVSLITNRSVRLPLDPGGNPRDIVEAFEQKNWGKSSGEINVEELTLELEIGSYYPAIARPFYNQRKQFDIPESEGDNAAAKSVWRELNVVTQDLERCFDVNSPIKNNEDAFGLAYEKVIYLCCIGVESLFRRVLAENKVVRKNLDMNVFVKLAEPLRLREYTLSVVEYPWLEQLTPFQGWLESSPSSSLPWFGAYNALKHDKRNNAHQASMKNALLAASAFYAAAYATFGTKLFPGFLSTSYYFHFTSRPAWPLSEMYFESDDAPWKVKHLSI